MEKRKELFAAISQSNQSEYPYHRPIFTIIETKFNPERWLHLYQKLYPPATS
jgi:hypothetical protein